VTVAEAVSIGTKFSTYELDKTPESAKMCIVKEHLSRLLDQWWIKVSGRAWYGDRKKTCL